MLDRQIQIYSIDTGNFYSNKEARLHKKNHCLRAEKKYLVEKQNRILNQLTENGVSLKELEFVCNGIKNVKDIIPSGILEPESMIELIDDYKKCCGYISLKTPLIKSSKESLQNLLNNKIGANIASNGKHHKRILNECTITDNNIISVFDSFLTRTIGALPDELSKDLMVVQVYYFDIIQDIMRFGFWYKGEKYVYLTSSAGQIRTKKTVFIKESVFKKYEDTLMCGLSIDVINKKGGSNPNKFLAYMALVNSATDLWNDFNIDKAIVIDDFETDVEGTYDFVSDEDFSIARMNGKIPVPHTDGSGMILPRCGGNRMIRLPWIKGLLGVFDFHKFIKINNCSPIIKDIYGVEHDVLDEDIEVIFTKSQFKMWKYYDSWDDYKQKYKKHGCTAGIAKCEEEKVKTANINYQMLQTLTDITGEEVDEIVGLSNKTLTDFCSSIKDIKENLGITEYNADMTYLQKSIDLYPDLVNDDFIKGRLRDIKDSLLKRYRSGKLKLDAKYTFVLPDFYAACEYWFMGIENPNGLLSDGEVYCSLYPRTEKLDCLRSPHLYKEHAIRRNVSADKQRCKILQEWFYTKAIYTSPRDLISKILMFDVDGDMLLVVADRKFVEIAERNMKGVVPLFYNMRKAQGGLLTRESIYKGLSTAFTSGNIGIYSNNISKIWNDDVFRHGSQKDKDEATNLVKILCMMNNMVIDFAKTLYKPDVPKDVSDKINDYIKGKLPYFFKFAKDKAAEQIDDKNGSVVNQIEGKIINPRLSFRKLGLKRIDHNLLMKNKNISYKVWFDDGIKLNKEKTEPLIIKYLELSKSLNNKLKNKPAIWVSPDKNIGTKTFEELCLKDIAREVKDELSKFGYSKFKIVDILVKFLYFDKKSSQKTLLWFCYGDIIYKNLYKNIRELSKGHKYAE